MTDYYIDPRTTGTKLRQIRVARGKTLEVTAGLAGISPAHLSNLENGKYPPSLKHLAVLANVLEVAPSEITKLPVPAPANGHTDAATERVRLALDAVDTGRPGGLSMPTGVLRDQVLHIQQARRSCEFATVSTELPGLIRNLHTTLNGGVDHAELLELAVYLHVHVTRPWLVHACAPTDLLRRSLFLAKRLAEEHGDATQVAVASYGIADALTISGSFETAADELASLTLPQRTPAIGGFLGFVALIRAVNAQHLDRLVDAAAAIEEAKELAERFGTTGELDSLGFFISPVDVAVFRMYLAIEENDPDKAMVIASGVDPRQHPFVTMRTSYYLDCGRALARLPGRHADAVKALRVAEGLFPTMMRRDSMVRDTLSSLLPRTKRDDVGRELRGMAHRAGLLV
jgi:transcriptional regulator with XRE-family HTH domain